MRPQKGILPDAQGTAEGETCPLRDNRFAIISALVGRYSLTFNAGNNAANKPARVAQLDHGNDCAILVQGDEGPAQVVRLGHSWHSID